jgi:hypothetical protein
MAFTSKLINMNVIHGVCNPNSINVILCFTLPCKLARHLSYEHDAMRTENFKNHETPVA